MILPTIHPRTRAVNKARNEIERMILDYPGMGELTSVEVAYILTELAFRYSGVALKDERDRGQQ